MTAPAIPSVQTPVAPIAPDLAALGRDPTLAMEETIKATLATVPRDEIPPVTDAPAIPEAVEPVVREDGAAWNDVAKRWTKDGQFVSGEPPVFSQPASAVPAAPVAEVPAVEEPIEPEIPEGFIAAKALDDDKAKVFKVFDGEDEVIAPALRWDIPVNVRGKTQTRSLSTDQVVAYTQMGVYNHEREQAYEQMQQHTQQQGQRATALEQEVQRRDQHISRLLSDPDFLVQAISRFEAENTPEMRLQREREQLNHDRQQQQFQRITEQSQHYITTELEPALEQIQAVCPDVSLEEMAAKLYLFSDRFRVNGVLMPQGFEPVGRYLVDDLVPWARQLNEARSTERRTPAADSPKSKDKPHAATAPVEQRANEVTQAQVRAQKVRRAATAPLKPAGRAMPDSPAPTTVRTGKEAEAAVISNTLAALRAG